MSLFERWLTLWVALCILAGLVPGNLLPGVLGALAGLEVASVNLLVAFAPIAAFLLGVTDTAVPWTTLVLSIMPCIVIPMIAGVLTRRAWVRQRRPVTAFIARIKPASVIGRLLTVVLPFGFQGLVILAQPLPNALTAVPVMLSLLAFANRTRHRFPA
jgi:ACR3 family arsenite transporter